MREKLRDVGSAERHVFVGRFCRTGWKSGYQGYDLVTVLLLDIKDESGNQVTDHLWFNMTKGFEEANLEEGDEVQFCARVKPYTKGYRGYWAEVYCPIQHDYKLSYPSKVINLTKQAKEKAANQGK